MSRRVLIVAGAVLAVALVATGVVMFMGTRKQAAPDAGFVWLETAMKECDAAAAREKDVLHLFVVPLQSEPAQAAEWRPLSLNDIGNAVILTGDDMLSALRKGTLRISTDDYVFSIRNEQNQSVYRWPPHTGVKWFSMSDTFGMTSLSMQIKPRSQGSDAAWGNPLPRHEGNCYWVNAVATP